MIQAPATPQATPTSPPTSSSKTMMPATSSRPDSAAAPVEMIPTSTTVGASLRPDSASSAPVRRLGSGTTRSTENTAAASVGEQIAPSRIASSQGRPSR